jgi:hypothetical protein
MKSPHESDSEKNFTTKKACLSIDRRPNDYLEMHQDTKQSYLEVTYLLGDLFDALKI